MKNNIDLAKKVLLDSTKTLYGIFSIICISSYFPPRVFLNEFLKVGSDLCDQDGRMEDWNPFELNEEEYLEVLSWWQEKYPDAVVDDLDSDNWNDWIEEILED